MFSTQIENLRAHDFPDKFAAIVYDFDKSFDQDMNYFRQMVDASFISDVNDLEDMEDLCMMMRLSISEMLKNANVKYDHIHDAVLVRKYALNKMKERASKKCDDDANMIHLFRKNFRNDSKILFQEIHAKFPDKVSYETGHMMLQSK